MPSKKIYGETAPADGEAAYRASLARGFDLPGHPEARRLGSEVSPYGPSLGVRYPAADCEALIAASRQAGAAWGRASPEIRTGVCLEALARLNARSFEIGHAVMHTSGQPFVMAFGDAGVSLSCNLTGNIFVNQSAAFSDYHVTGANPAGNACLTDATFVANRFRIVAVRRLLAA